jgi:tetratricopeptide (TPR) repeat protein
METLYELLGALPNDDADGLRSAFRKAVKGSHPDLHPGDPLAGQKFRQIVRANEILADGDQRAAYDHLLELARAEKATMSKRAVTHAVYKLASAVFASAVISIMAVGAYEVLLHMSARSIAHTVQLPAILQKSSEVAAVATPETQEMGDHAADKPATTGKAPDKTASTGKSDAAKPIDPDQAIASSALTFPIDASGVLVAMLEPTPAPVPVSVPPPAAGDAKSFREHGIVSYRNGDLNGAVADFDQAIQLDPKFAAAYIDRGIVLYRLRKFDRAFADIAQAKRLEKEGHGDKEAHPDKDIRMDRDIRPERDIRGSLDSRPGRPMSLVMRRPRLPPAGTVVAPSSAMQRKPVELVERAN